jgi:hypothetical protein
MQYQVPQFIETEDKVVGPFSIRQFIYVGIAGVISGVAYFILQTWLFVIVAIIFMGGALALSFIKINGRPLIKVGLSAFSFYWKPQTYVWKPVDAIQQPKPAAPVVRKLPPVETIASAPALHKTLDNLQTGTPAAKTKTSDRQFIEKKMAERYEIFQRQLGDRAAARRVDYR